jgi:hypothetical protein
MFHPVFFVSTSLIGHDIVCGVSSRGQVSIVLCTGCSNIPFFGETWLSSGRSHIVMSDGEIKERKRVKIILGSD